MPARRKRKTRQAPEGEEEETELAQYEHGEAAADAVAEDLQAGIREMVLYALGSRDSQQGLLVHGQFSDAREFGEPRRG
jgi:hypothetical protein